MVLVALDWLVASLVRPLSRQSVVSVRGRSVEVLVGELVVDVDEWKLVLPKVLGVVLGPVFSRVLVEGLVLLDIKSFVVTVENELGLFLFVIIFDASVKA